MLPAIVFALALLIACKPSEPRSGPGVELEKTAKQLWRACDGGSAASCIELDRLLDDKTGSAGVVRVQLRSSYDSERLMRRACEGGDGATCYEVARKQPSRQRRSYLERACNAGHTPACNDLADQNPPKQGSATPAEAWDP